MQSSRTRILISILAIILLVLVIFVAVKTIDNHNNSVAIKPTVQSAINKGSTINTSTGTSVSASKDTSPASTSKSTTSTSVSSTPLQNTGPGNVGELFTLSAVGGYIVKRTLILAKSRN